MAFMADAAYDAALNWLRTNGTRIDFCSSEPATYAAIAGVSLANQTGITISANQDAAGGGREAEIPDTVSASVTADGTITHWAVSDGASVLVATGDMTAGVPVLVGGGSNTFDLDAVIPLRFPDAVNI